MGIDAGRHAARGDSAVARLRIRQSRDAAAAAGHGDRAARVVRAAPAHRRRAPVCGARVSRRAVHVSPLRRESAGRTAGRRR